MTNEEAIMILKAMIDEMILVFDRDRKKALNMAIEALKAQLSNTSEIPNGSDLISRQTAIDEWRNDFKGYVNALNIPRDDYNGIMAYIDELPSAQSKHDQNTPQKQPDLDTFGVKTGETCEDVIRIQDAIDVILSDKIDDASLEIMTALGEGRLALTLNDACDRHIRDIEKLPSAQQEIIHCKDCIHWINKHLCEIWSRYGTIETKPYFYCGFGVRRNNE